MHNKPIFLILEKNSDDLKYVGYAFIETAQIYAFTTAIKNKNRNFLF